MGPFEKVRAKLQALDAPAMLVTDIGNVQWLTGFTGSAGAVIVTQEGGAFLTDSRYAIQAREQVREVETFTYASPVQFHEFLAEQVRRLAIRRLAFEDSVTVGALSQWKASSEDVEFVATKDALAGFRMIKTPEEIARIRAACELADACFGHVRRMLQPGVAEYDIALDVEFYLRRSGAKLAFPPIVASGPNSAKPHGEPGERQLRLGDFVTIDLGANLDGYCSDITRTVVIGKASDRHREIYERVLEAQVRAIEAMAPGANGRDVDQLVRDVLDRDGAGLARHFGHSLGHGLGKAVHDAGKLSVAVDQPIEPGQVWTIEPGVYIDGFGGVRIEDDIVITPDGNEVLTRSTKDLLELG
jgi:Xaa-Pro aminopeptidase